MDIKDVFSSNLIKYRKLKGYSQVKLAELTGLHKTYISDVELKKKSISLRNIQKIADALEVPCYVLFLGVDENNINQRENRTSIISYEQFNEELSNSITLENSFYYDLLVDMIEKPDRYIGLFRTTDVKTKLLKSVIQNQEVKFDKFMKKIMIRYIEEIGCTNISKNVFNNEKQNACFNDKVFQIDNTVYFIEQKIRDNYSSIKKKKLFDDLKMKYSILKQKCPYNEVCAVMWFIDDNFKQNKKYFSEKVSNEQKEGVNVNVFYGGTLFLELFNRIDVWEEIYSYLLKSKQERSKEVPILPDFDTGEEISNAIEEMKKNNSKLFKKLISDDERFVKLRESLFPTRQLT